MRRLNRKAVMEIGTVLKIDVLVSNGVMLVWIGSVISCVALPLILPTCNTEVASVVQ